MPLKLIIYDGRSKGTEAALLAKRLAEQDKVVAIIGPGTSPTTMPVIPYVSQAGVPTFSMGSSDRIIEPSATKATCCQLPTGKATPSRVRSAATQSPVAVKLAMSTPPNRPM